jgi:hypothetical protein
VHALPAKIVLAALEDGHVHVATECGRRKGHVVRQQLRLQRLRRRRHHDAQPRLQSRNEIGEALSRAGARLREQMLAPTERLGDRRREVLLLGPCLVVVKHRGEPSPVPEDIRHGDRLGGGAAAVKLSQRAHFSLDRTLTGLREAV